MKLSDTYTIRKYEPARVSLLNQHEISFVYIKLPNSIEAAAKQILGILTDKEKARIKNATREELQYIYYSLGLEIERAMLRFHERDTTLYDSLTGKAVPISEAYNNVIRQLRWHLKNRNLDKE